MMLRRVLLCLYRLSCWKLSELVVVEVGEGAVKEPPPLPRRSCWAELGVYSVVLLPEEVVVCEEAARLLHSPS